MENTTKEQIISTCQKIMSDSIRYHQPMLIKEDYSSDYYYEIKASTILQIHQTSIAIYSSAKLKIDDNIEILGRCDDLSFLGPQHDEENSFNPNDIQTEIDDIIEMLGDCFGFSCINI